MSDFLLNLSSHPFRWPSASFGLFITLPAVSLTPPFTCRLFATCFTFGTAEAICSAISGFNRILVRGCRKWQTTTVGADSHQFWMFGLWPTTLAFLRFRRRERPLRIRLEPLAACDHTQDRQGTTRLTDPKMVYVLRWIAGRHAGIPEFNPGYLLA